MGSGPRIDGNWEGILSMYEHTHIHIFCIFSYVCSVGTLMLQVVAIWKPLLHWICNDFVKVPYVLEKDNRHSCKLLATFLVYHFILS